MTNQGGSSRHRLTRAELGTLIRVYDRRRGLLGCVTTLERLCSLGLLQQVRTTKVIPGRGVVDCGPDWAITKAGVEACRPPSLSSRQMRIMRVFLQNPRQALIPENSAAEGIMRTLFRSFCVERDRLDPSAYRPTKRGLTAARMYEQDLREGVKK